MSSEQVPQACGDGRGTLSNMACVTAGPIVAETQVFSFFFLHFENYSWLLLAPQPAITPKLISWTAPQWFKILEFRMEMRQAKAKTHYCVNHRAWSY